jgi:LPXTG-motif cell wall-anchored protein
MENVVSNTSIIIVGIVLVLVLFIYLLFRKFMA